MEFVRCLPGGPVEIRPARFIDDRGYFSETFRADRLAAALGEGKAPKFIQENESLSVKVGTIRGLHFQLRPAAQAKLVRCTSGALLDVAVDLRHASKTFGKVVTVELSAENGSQLWIPEGFAHGFCTLVPHTIVSYKVTAYYSPEHDKGLAWDDPAIGVKWPDCANLDTLSAKDRIQPKLADLPAYFTYEA